MTEILLETLDPPRMATKRSCGVVDRIAQEIDLFLHQIADSILFHELRHADVGAVSTVCGAEGIVHENIRQRSQILAEFFAVLCLFLAVSCIFKEHYLSVLQRFGCGFRIRSDDFGIRCENDFLSQQLGQALCYGSQGKLGLRLSLRLSQMGAEDDAAAVANQLLNRGQRRDQTVLVVIFPSCSGTLKSQRTSTFCPFT